MIPLLIEASSSRNAGVKKLADSIVYKIQNLSGQKINKMNASRWCFMAIKYFIILSRLVQENSPVKTYLLGGFINNSV